MMPENKGTCGECEHFSIGCRVFDRNEKDPECAVRTNEKKLKAEIAAWMDTAAQHLRSEGYYRGLIQRCGKVFGITAYIQEDGGKSEDILCAKVPELVEQLQKRKDHLYSLVGEAG